MAIPDLMKRFTETPFEIVLGLSGRSIRVQTNSQAIADQLQRTLSPCASNALDMPDFVLRVVVEFDDDLDPERAPTIHRLSHDGLSFVSLGQKSFVACDRQGREGICFISQNLVSDEKQLSGHFLPTVISLVKESLGNRTPAESQSSQF
jgi:hypothetical protein